MASVGFLRLASKWPNLMRRWQAVEKQLPAFSSWREREELSSRIKNVTFVLITLSLSKSTGWQVIKFKQSQEEKFIKKQMILLLKQSKRYGKKSY